MQAGFQKLFFIMVLLPGCLQRPTTTEEVIPTKENSSLMLFASCLPAQKAISTDSRIAVQVESKYKEKEGKSLTADEFLVLSIGDPKQPNIKRFYLNDKHKTAFQTRGEVDFTIRLPYVFEMETQKYFKELSLVIRASKLSKVQLIEDNSAPKEFSGTCAIFKWPSWAKKIQQEDSPEETTPRPAE